MHMGSRHAVSCDHAYTVDYAMLVPNVQSNVSTGAICVYALCMITVLWSQD